jgi:uncharacterized protein (UPF0335 family)
VIAKIAAIIERLARLESEKSELEARLDRLLSAQEAADVSSAYDFARQPGVQLAD